MSAEALKGQQNDGKTSKRQSVKDNVLKNNLMDALKILFYDVEHGSCTHIITPNGKHILVDVGSKSDKSIVDYICNRYFYGLNGSLDALIITHPHEDHIYDLPRLNERLHPKVLFRPTEAFEIEPSSKTPVHINIANNANQMNSSYKYPIPDTDNIENPQSMGGVKITLIPSVLNLHDKTDLNTFSSLVIVEYTGIKFVITGDNSPRQLKYMVDNNYYGIRLLAADAAVLLAPHHGRTGEYCPDFFKLVNPVLTVISDKSVEHTTQEESSNVYKGIGTTINDNKRYVLTTRSDGNISFSVSYGCWDVALNVEKY